MTEAIKGLNQLLKNMADLPDRLKGDAFIAGTRSAAAVIAREARRLVPVGRGQDTANTGVKSKKKRIHLRDTIKVRKSYAKYGKINYQVHAGKGLRYAHLVEFGSAPHSIAPRLKKAMILLGRFSSSANHPGSKARPFMRPALDNKYRQAIDKFGQATDKAIKKLRFKL